MNCNHRCYECHIPACPDRVRQSIGPRIVPMFADPPEWSADKVYSPLTLVIHNGATYMSRRCVPANTALPDTDPFYNESWVMVYDMNAQVAQYREEVAQLSQQVTDFGGKIDNWEQLIVQWTALIQSWQNQFPELTKDLAAITERVAAIEPKLAQAQKDIAALQATQQTHTEQIAANTQGLADLTPRVAAAETHLSALDEEQKVQDEHLNNLDASQTEQDTRIQANHDLAVQAKTTADNNTQQIAENAGKIAANAAEIAKHAEQLDALKAADTALDGKISQNTAAIAQNTADIAQAKTDIKQAAAAAQQAQDTATHADAAAAQAQTTAQAAQKAAQAAQSAADQAKADNTTQDGRLDALEAKITQEVEDRTEADNAIKQEIANLTDGTTEMPYVKKSGDSMTGDLSMGTRSITQAYAIQLNGDNPTAFVNSNNEAAIASIATPNNYKVLNVARPVKDTHAATKKYVDQAVQNATGGITPDVSKLKQDVAALQESQTTQDSKISAAAQTAQTAQETAQAAKTTADQAAQDVASIKNGSTALPYIKDTGDTVTGTYDFTGADLTVKTPTADASPATKAYVDSKITGLENGSTALPYVKKAGDSMTGVLNMSNNKVTNVADPTENGDAVNYKTMNAMKTDLENKISDLSDLLDAANQKIQDLEQRVEELEQNPPQPSDPTTKFNQIDLSNYVGILSGSTVNTASDFKAALQYILDNNSGKHFYYGTDHRGTTWYFASDTELSALSNDSYTCGNGVQNNGTAVQETFKMNKYVKPVEIPSWLNGINTEKITKVYTSDKTFRYTQNGDYFTHSKTSDLANYVNDVNTMLNENKFTHYILFARNRLDTEEYCAIVVGTNDEITTGINQAFRYVNNSEPSMIAFDGGHNSRTGWCNNPGTGTLTISTLS